MPRAPMSCPGSPVVVQWKGLHCIELHGQCVVATNVEMAPEADDETCMLGQATLIILGSTLLGRSSVDRPGRHCVSHLEWTTAGERKPESEKKPKAISTRPCGTP